MDFGWRDAVLVLAALVAVYLLIALLGVAKLRQKRPTVRDLPAAAQSFAATVPPAAPAAPAATVPFADQLAIRAVEAEVRQLRDELAQLREELAQMKAFRRVSPMYETALDLGRRGFDARGVAEECGISVAEAELVLALARDGGQVDREIADDGSGQRLAAEHH